MKSVERCLAVDTMSVEEVESRDHALYLFITIVGRYNRIVKGLLSLFAMRTVRLLPLHHAYHVL
jgi:hypothetical protein